MRYVWIALLLLATSVTALTYLSASGDDDDRRPLRVFAAAGLRRALEPAAAYERQTGQAVELHWGGTGALYGQIKAGAACDVFLPGDTWTAQRGTADGLLTEATPVATQRPALAVASGNPKQIVAWRDLLREDVTVSMADPDQAATGRAVREALGADRWEQLRARVKVLKPTVADSAADVQLGAADAAFVWDHMASGPSAWPGLELIELVEPALPAEAVMVAVPSSSGREEAREFATWLSRPDGQSYFAAAGFGLSDATSYGAVTVSGGRGQARE